MGLDRRLVWLVELKSCYWCTDSRGPYDTVIQGSRRTRRHQVMCFYFVHKWRNRADDSVGETC